MKKRKNTILAALMALLMLAGTAIPNAQAASADETEEPEYVTIEQGKLIYYGSSTYEEDNGHSTFITKQSELGDGVTRYVYCTQPSMPHPGSGTYKIDKLYEDTGSDTGLRKVIYYMPNCRGYQKLTKERWFTGEWEDSEKRYALAHVILSWWRDGYDENSDAFLGCQENYRKKAKEIIKDIKTLPDPPENFKAFWIKMAGCQDMVGGYLSDEYGQCRIKKVSANTVMTNGNDCYSRAGAEFEIRNSAGELVETLVTDEDGNTPASKLLPAGKYTVTETKTPPGYAKPKEGTKYTVYIDNEKTETLTIENDPKGDPVEIILEKAGGLSENSSPQGAASLEGAEFTVKFYKGHYTREQLASLTPARTWVFKSDSKGQCGLGTKWLIAERSDELYKSSKGIPTIPLGTVSIQETKAPTGYKIDDTLHVQQVKDDPGSVLEGIHTFNELIDEDAVIEPVIKGGVMINKQDSRTGQQEQGDATFEKAAFAIINNSASSVVVEGKESAPGQTVKTIYTEEDDIARTSADCLPYGDYIIRESKPPAGYLNTGTIEKSFQIREDGKIVDLTKTPIKNDVIRGGVQVEKWDKELDKPEALGGAGRSTEESGTKLTGIEFNIVNRSQNPVMVGGKLHESGKTVAAITTAWNEEKQAYTAQTPSDYLPYGTYSIQGIKTNDTYLLTDGEARYFEIRENGRVVIADRAGSDLVFKNQVVRGDLEFVKVEDGTLKRLANVPFRLTNKATGEQHVLVTDRNGQASTKSAWNRHTVKTNANDKLMELENIRATDVDETAGIWFGLGENGTMASPDDSLGALPYGTYVIDELRCETNKDLTLLEGIEIRIYRNNDMTDAGTLTDDYDSVIITTSAMDKELESRNSMARDNITIVDAVEYEGVKPDREYTLTGTVYDKGTGSPLVIDGKAVTNTVKFTPKKTKGSVEVEFIFDASSLRGKDIVVFETLMADDIVVAEHKDIGDRNQTISFHDPKIATKASDAGSGEQEAMADEKTVIKDKISYEDLLGGQSYEAVGTLYDKETGKPVLAGGKPVTETKTFHANKGTGETEMKFSFDAGELAGKTIVVFQKILWEGETIAVHADIENKDQMICFPAIGTQAADSETKNNVSHADSKVTIIDTVSYSNLTPGKSYTITGKLVNKDTGRIIKADGNPVTSRVDFVPQEPDGQIEVAFTFSGIELDGKTVVAFEELKRGDVTVAVHADVNDEAQSIYFPAISTTAYEKDTEDKTIEPDEEVTVTDIVEFENLVPGEKYEIEGVIVDKETGEEIESEPVIKEFTPDKPDGFVEMDFVIDTSNLEGKELVVFETLSLNGKVVAKHDDINSKEQTVIVEDGDVTIVKTGDEIPLVVMIATLFLILSLVTGLRIISRKREIAERK